MLWELKKAKYLPMLECPQRGGLGKAVQDKGERSEFLKPAPSKMNYISCTTENGKSSGSCTNHAAIFICLTCFVMSNLLEF